MNKPTVDLECRKDLKTVANRIHSRRRKIEKPGKCTVYMPVDMVVQVAAPVEIKMSTPAVLLAPVAPTRGEIVAVEKEGTYSGAIAAMA